MPVGTLPELTTESTGCKDCIRGSGLLLVGEGGAQGVIVGFGGWKSW